MKKVAFSLVVLLLAVPAMADVVITAADAGDGWVAISYDASTEAELPRAFGLDITVTDEAANIVDVDTAGAQPFGIYMGTIVIEDGEVTDDGTPVAPADDPGAAGALGGPAITVEMGSLYEEGVETPPDASGLLLKVQVDGSCEVCVSENAIRGGVVMEDANNPDVVDLTGACASVEVAPPVCVGDVDDNGFVNPGDIGELVSYLEANASPPFYTVASDNPAYSAAADVDGNGFVNPGDIGELVSFLEANGSPPFYSVPCE